MLNLTLLHYPCIDRLNKEVATAIYPLDIQDIARSSATFGVETFFVVHPEKKQREFAERITSFWSKEGARQWNKHRTRALKRVHILSSLDDIIALFKNPILIATSAKIQTDKIIPYKKALELSKSYDVIVILGTGHGLHKKVFNKIDYQLPPIKGPTDYNHLSVRAAAGIILHNIAMGVS